jgi:hypothetical protein
MQDKWEINLKKTWKLDTENDMKVDRSINIANTYNKFFTCCVEISESLVQCCQFQLICLCRDLKDPVVINSSSLGV